MQKLVSLGAVLLFLVGIVVSSQPASALPPCSCSYCANRPTNLCVNFEDGGFWFRCSDYTELFCFGLSAAATEKVAPVPEFFPLEFLGVPAPDGHLYPSLPLVKTRC